MPVNGRRHVGRRALRQLIIQQNLRIVLGKGCRRHLWHRGFY